jgi:membrane protein implicated in regulation of membrane protease activity
MKAAEIIFFSIQCIIVLIFGYIWITTDLPIDNMFAKVAILTLLVAYLIWKGRRIFKSGNKIN